jgi:arabinofuranan 3-O-arabinosyltransferase
VALADPDMPPPATADSVVAVDVERNDARARDIEIAACPNGCWIVLGEGFNAEWEATLDGSVLGPPVSVDGGFNGWRLPPSDTPSAVTFRWTAQTPVTLGLVMSALAALACVAIAFGAARSAVVQQRRPRLVARRSAPTSPQAWAAALTLVGSCGLLISPLWAVAALAPAAALVVTQRRSATSVRIVEITAVSATISVAISVLWIVRSDRPFPNAGWTLAVDHLNGLALYAAIAIAIGSLFAPDAASGRT